MTNCINAILLHLYIAFELTGLSEIWVMEYGKGIDILKLPIVTVVVILHLAFNLADLYISSFKHAMPDRSITIDHDKLQ